MNGEGEFPANCLRICVNSQEDANELSGVIDGVGLRTQLSFQDTAEMLLLIDAALDTIGWPQSYHKVRSFYPDEQHKTSYKGNPVKYQSSETIRGKAGELKTVDAIIMSRQHSSWQGVLKNPDGEIIGRFQSDLEFLGMLVHN